MRLPTYYISHGGGPWPFMAGAARSAHARLQSALQDMPRQIGMTPSVVLMISAHWEEPRFTVMGGAHPPMLYDYYGFPPETYQVQYRAPGSVRVARQIQRLVEDAGLPCDLDEQRGFDHGAFAPLAIIYPDANVPVVQLSLHSGFHPDAHLALGRALAPLRDQGVLILGSGMSYHNMSTRGAAAQTASRTFDAWLGHTLIDLPPPERADRIGHWTQAPAARAAHPREEHLLPLMVALGAAQDDSAVRVYHQEDFFGGLVVSSFRFGDAAGDATPLEERA